MRNEARSEQATKDPALQTWHAVNLDLATTKGHYITAMHALNLQDRQSGETGGPADWHGSSCTAGVVSRASRRHRRGSGKAPGRNHCRVCIRREEGCFGRTAVSVLGVL